MKQEKEKGGAKKNTSKKATLKNAGKVTANQKNQMISAVMGGDEDDLYGDEGGEGAG